MNDFIEQINIISDPTGQTPLSNTTFYSNIGLSTNTGTPQSPKKDPIDGVPTAIAVLGADQIYSNLIGNKNYIGDGLAIFDGNSTDSITTLIRESQSLHFRFYTTVDLNTTGDTNVLRNMIFESNGLTRFRNAAESPASIPTHETLFFKNTDILDQGNTVNKESFRFSRCVFFSNQSNNLTINVSDGHTDYHESNIYIGYNIVTTQEQIEKFRFNFIDNCSFVIDNVSYADLAELQAAIPTACPNSVTTGAQILGDLNNNEYHVVADSSSLLNSGYLGANIGNVNIGIVMNGNNIQSSTNVDFSNGISLIDNSISGEVIWDLVAPRVMTNPKLILNGTPDYVNNLFRSVQVPQPEKPMKLTCKIETSDSTGVFKPIRIFVFGYSIAEDQNGLASGESDYHELGILIERMYGFRVTLEIQP